MRRQTALAASLVAAAAAAVYFPILGHDFLWNWDDALFFLGEPPRVWSTSQGTFAPLPHLLYAALRAIQGQSPFGFHLLSLLVHAANAAAFFYFCLTLLERRGRPGALPAAVAALLFAVHPLMAESVTWATSITDLMGALFFLLAASCWLRRRPRAALILFVLAGLCRWKTFCLPVGLVLIDAWLGEKRPLAGKAPFFAVAAVILALGARSKAQTFGPDAGRPEARTVAAAAVWLPLKLVAPAGLVPVYPVDAQSRPLGLGGGFWLAALPLLLLACARFSRGALYAALFYLTALAPVLLYPRAPPILLRDQYAYLSCLGFFAGAAALERRAALAAAVCAVLVLGGAARRRVVDWKDAVTLWRAAMTQEPASAIFRYKAAEALNAQGAEADARGDSARSLEALLEAERLAPGSGGVALNLGIGLAKAGRLEESVPRLQRAAALEPQDPRPGRWLKAVRRELKLKR